MFDTHAHLCAGAFDDDREQTLRRLQQAGVTLYLEAGTTVADSERCIAWAQAHEGVVASAGIHPHEASGVDQAQLDQLRVLLGRDKCVALGEIGLDYHYDFAPREVQQRVFADQLDLAIELQLPVIIHDREAHADTMALLQARKGKLQGVLHCYSGSQEDAKRYLDLGYYLGFDGPITFKNADKLRDVVRAVPLDRLLVETDSPYLTPHPHRGQRNEPTYLPLIIERMAEVKGVSAQAMARQTEDNGKRLFRL